MSAAETDASLGEVSNEAKMRPATEKSQIADSSFLTRLANSFSAFLGSIKLQRRERVMSLCETLPLGEKRFLAIVEVEQQRFLIAATNQSVSLLHCLDNSKDQQNGHQDVTRETGNC